MNKFIYRLKHDIPHMIHNIKAPRNRLLQLFAIEGVLFTLVNNLINNNNNLFATRLGANDFELSLVILLPQLAGMLVLLPGGILTDRMSNKRNMVVGALATVTVIYVLIGFVPALDSGRLGAFLILLALSAGPMTMYNVSWQAYFSDVVGVEARNRIWTARTGLAFLIGIAVPICSGALLASAATTDAKITIHQIFFWIGCVLLITQIAVLRRINSNQEHQSSGIGIRDLKAAFLELAHNKKFLSFVSVAMFFYVTWQIDWTLYFVGEVYYLGMNEVWLSYLNISTAVIQFITIGFWSRINARFGVRFGIIFGSFGLAFCPISMIVATSIPPADGKLIFLIMNTISNLAFATVSLNILQCLLQVLPERNKTLSISIYTVLVSLSNAVMPLAGVSIYRLFGADKRALQTVFWIIFVFRIISTGLWTLRWWTLRKLPDSCSIAQ